MAVFSLKWWSSPERIILQAMNLEARMHRELCGEVENDFLI